MREVDNPNDAKVGGWKEGSIYLNKQTLGRGRVKRCERVRVRVPLKRLEKEEA